MILIGVINVIVGYCSYTRPSDVHERIVPDVPFARGSGIPSGAAHPATGCAPAITARIDRDMPGATIIDCAPARVTVMRGDRRLELDLTGDAIRRVAGPLA